MCPNPTLPIAYPFLGGGRGRQGPVVHLSHAPPPPPPEPHPPHTILSDSYPTPSVFEYDNSLPPSCLVSQPNYSYRLHLITLSLPPALLVSLTILIGYI
jgi:hypothetical protein